MNVYITSITSSSGSGTVTVSLYNNGTIFSSEVISLSGAQTYGPYLNTFSSTFNPFSSPANYLRVSLVFSGGNIIIGNGALYVTLSGY